MTRALMESESPEMPVESGADLHDSGPSTGSVSITTDDLSSRTEVNMTGPTLKRTVQINNPGGFHMRPKAEFAKLAAQFDSLVKVTWQGWHGNGKSMWDLMLVSAEQGDEVTVEVTGHDARAAIEALTTLLATASLSENAEVGLAENL